MRRLLAAVLLSVLVPAAHAAAAAKPFGTLDCPPQEGVRFCAGEVATFDGVPLDVHVTLPAGGDGPFPLIVLSHGWGGQRFPLKDGAQADNPSGGSLPWAVRGYAVLSITSRGFHGSCGQPQNRNSAGCLRGWIKLDDTRYEVRDVQHLAGLLVDDGLVDPQRIGVHGGSYGGGVSNALALLRDRVMNQDGTYAPWRSPKGVGLRLAAAAPYIPWSDLVYALVPNGRHLDYVLPKPDDSRKPYGVMKQSFVSGLFATGQTSGFYAPPGADGEADLNRWYAAISAGEPYDGNPMIAEAAEQLYRFKSSISIARTVEPAPIFIANGWADDIFPVDEALRLYNVLRTEFPQLPLAMMHFDFGHQRAEGKPADMNRYRGKVVAWMDRWVKGDGSAGAPTGVETLTQTCPDTAPSGGPYNAPTWEAIHPGEVVYREPSERSVTNGGGDPNVARAIDPVAAGNNPCATTASGDEPGTINYRLPPAAGPGYTLMGSPTVIADIAATGASPQLVARLWDVGADGQQTLVARTVYRPGASGRQVFQLHPSGWRFAPEHFAKLQLLGRDPPYARPSNGAFSVTVKNLELRLPVVEKPGAVSVRTPAVPFVPQGATALPGTKRAARKRRPKLRLRVSCRSARVYGFGVRRVTFTRAGMRPARDGSRPFSMRLRGRGRTVRATVVLRDGRSFRLRARVPRRCSRR